MIRLTKRLGLGAGDWPWIGFLFPCAFLGWQLATNPPRQAALIVGVSSMVIFGACWIVYSYIVLRARAGATPEAVDDSRAQTASSADTQSSSKNVRLRVLAFGAISVVALALKLWSVAHNG